MQHPLDFYTNTKAELAKQAALLKAKSIHLSFLRFVTFLGTCFLIYLWLGNSSLVFMAAFLGALLFVFLILKYNNLKRERNILDEKIKINETEIRVLNRDFQHLETGAAFVNSAHFYSNDIDLFGKGSFFQYLNRTNTNDGKIVLANTLTENTINGIVEKQHVLKELSSKVVWRQHFAALARLVSVKNTSKSIVNWISKYVAVLPKYIAKIQVLFSSISLLLIGLFSFGFISFTYITIWFFMGLFITDRFLKKTQNLYTEADSVRKTFRQYHPLLNEIENTVFTSKILKEKQQIIASEDKKAATIFKEFSRILDTFDQRNNIIIAVVGNGLFLSEIYNACKVEKWISKYQHTVKKWFEVVAFFDAENTLANFHFNHPKFIFPEITSEIAVISGTDLGHPLLKIQNRIDNNFNINKEEFFIVTGANMAGKSTFLRTISLSIVMANCGLPVCATSFKYAPIKLITSMRTTDSLTEDASYFYSELKRLKFIVDEIDSENLGENYFIILDEILKGTNSKDKAIGSKRN